MKRIAVFVTLALTAWQPLLPAKHWCAHPVQQLRWLRQLIDNAQSWSPNHYGWEVHQARYHGHEVFVLHLCRYCGLSRGFLLYDHHGDLIEQGEGADSVRLGAMTEDRLLAANPGRYSRQP